MSPINNNYLAETIAATVLQANGVARCEKYCIKIFGNLKKINSSLHRKTK